MTVAVIGAGFTGLAAALNLAEGGASVIVVDAQAPGYGASGRNGGQVIPGLKLDPDALDRLFGPATTDFAGRAADTVFDLIARHSIDCAARRGGWIQASLKHAHLPMLERRMKAWAARGASAAMLDAAEIAKATGAEGFVGGWLDRRASSLHPLNYAFGLARRAQGAGARLHGRSPATGLTREGMRWRVRIEDKGVIRADRVVLATNGYTGALWPELRATMIPASSFQVATEPLAPDVCATILSGAAAVSDTRRVGNYFRLSPDGRLVMGGRAALPTRADPPPTRISRRPCVGSIRLLPGRPCIIAGRAGWRSPGIICRMSMNSPPD